MAGSTASDSDGGPLGDPDTLPPVEQIVETKRTEVACSDGVVRELVEYLMPVTIDVVSGVAAGLDGNIWFAVPKNDAIGRLNPVGSFVQFALPIPAPRPWMAGIAAGPDGNLWFTEGGTVGRISLTGAISQFTFDSDDNVLADGIAAGPDGNVWFAIPIGKAVGRITPTGTITKFPTRGGCSGITTGPDGNLWLTQGANGMILRMTVGGQIGTFPVPRIGDPSPRPQHITSGPDGNLWFTENFGKNVGRITPEGTLTEFPIPKARALPSPGGITSGAGALWLAMQDMNRIFRVSTSGDMTECPLPDPNGGAGDITMGPDGKLYFAEQGNKIGRLTP